MNEVVPEQFPPIHPSESFLDLKFKTATHVFIRVDRVRRPLEAPYEKTFEVALRTPTHYTSKRRGMTDNVHVSRLKVAHDIDNVFSARPLPDTMQIGNVPPTTPFPEIPPTPGENLPEVRCTQTTMHPANEAPLPNPPCEVSEMTW